MKEHALEPGLAETFRLYILVNAAVLPFLLRFIGWSFDINVAWDRYLLLIMPVPLFMVVYTTIPWFRQRMGRAFLPVGLTLFSANVLLEKFLTLAWLITPSLRELTTLLLMLRLWVVFQLMVAFVAWQYDLFWVTAASISLGLLDGVLSLPFVTIQGPLYPLYVLIVGLRLLAVSIVSLALAWAMNRQRSQRAALADANRKLAHYATTIEQLAITQERNRLAREMHDTLAHSLSAATVQLEAVSALWDTDGNAARAMLEQVQQVTRNGLTEARRALQALRASPLEDVGLAVAVSNLARSAAARAGLALDLNVPNQLDNLLPDVEQCVYRVAQEALTNVARHADAKSLRVALTHANGQLSLTVGDDGRGFDTAVISGTRFGLSGLRERAEMVGGTLVVESVPTQGTTVRLTVQDGKLDLPAPRLSAKL